MSITLVVRHPDPELRTISGFNQFWAYYVRGFNHEVHCQPCLRGKRSAVVSRRETPLGVELVFNETENYNQLYICGLASGPKPERCNRNLHLALVEAHGEQIEEITYNGFSLLLGNVRRLMIPPPMPELSHLGVEHYRCKNFRFGVEYYGYPGVKAPPIAAAVGRGPCGNRP
jgi:hypothetical protein